MTRILFLEDDKDYQEVITTVLENAGYQVECTNTVNDAYQKFKGKSYDLVISDLKLDGLNGFQLVELVRGLNPSIRILILTSSEMPADEVVGLDLGVSDYLNKSVSFMVLLKRIEWILNRGSVAHEEVTVLKSEKEDLQLNLSERVAYISGKAIKLSYFEFEILAFFLRHKNRAITRTDFMKEIWGSEGDSDFFEERNVDTHIKNIRAKTGLRSIHSIRSVGYKWIE